jgi:hypothetical protein
LSVFFSSRQYLNLEVEHLHGTFHHEEVHEGA